jgi:hypothetical protein
MNHEFEFLHGSPRKSSKQFAWSSNDERDCEESKMDPVRFGVKKIVTITLLAAWGVSAYNRIGSINI